MMVTLSVTVRVELNGCVEFPTFTEPVKATETEIG
jgi:hypothetical protein